MSRNLFLFGRAHIYTTAYTDSILTLKTPITTAADNILKYFYFNFSKETSLDISCESTAKQTIHMKYQEFFSLKKKKINK